MGAPAPPRNYEGAGDTKGSQQSNYRWVRRALTKFLPLEGGVISGDLEVEGELWTPGGSGVVTRRASTTTLTSFTNGTEKVLTNQNVTLPIPTSWGGYDIEAFGYTRWTDASGGSTAVGNGVFIRVRLTNASGTVFSGTPFQEHTDSNNHDAHVHPYTTFLEGQSATGNVVVTVTGSLNPFAYNIGCNEGVLIARAWRTS